MVAMANIPTVDLGGRSADRSTLDQAAGQVAHACRTIGFLVIRNHGVPMQEVEAMRRVSLAFFAQAEADKLSCHLRTPFGTRGYSPMGAENNARSLHGGGLPDLKEYFTMGKPHGADEPLADHAVPNAWPALPGFVAAWQRYFAAMEDLTDHLNLVFARALDVPDDFFRRHTQRHCSTLRAIHYPSSTGEVTAGRQRSGEHTDFGSFTILWSDHQRGGLEVRDPSGSWVPVAPAPGSFIVNIGDLMAQWTNDRFVSTLHRVVNPPPEAVDTGRLSLVYFHHPDAETPVAAVPTCVGPQAPARYPPILAGEHRRRKVALATGY